TVRFGYETVSNTAPQVGSNPAPVSQRLITQTGFNNLARLTHNISPTTVNQFSVAQTDDKIRGSYSNLTLPPDVKINHYYPLAEADLGRNRVFDVTIARGWAGLNSPAPLAASDGEWMFSD